MIYSKNGGMVNFLLLSASLFALFFCLSIITFGVLQEALSCKLSIWPAFRLDSEKLPTSFIQSQAVEMTKIAKIFSSKSLSFQGRTMSLTQWHLLLHNFTNHEGVSHPLRELSNESCNIK